MQLDVVNSHNDKVGTVDVRDEVFGGRVNADLVWESVVHANAAERQGTHAAKNRALVSGSGKKPWRQKGTGRARVGEIRNPLWRHGGTVHPPRPRSYDFKLSKKVELGALRAALAEKMKAGDQVLVGGVFKDGERVDVIGISRGHGFQGVVKRHHFRGGAATHGSMFHRAPGSIGASSFPSHVVKGMRAAGRMGGGRVTIHNLKVLRVDPENHLLIVEGGIPGAPESYVIIRKAVTLKKLKVAQVEKPKKGKK